MKITGDAYIMALEDAETIELSLNPSVIEVSQYNVQKAPLSISVTRVVGADRTPLKCYLSLKVKSVDLVLDTIDLGNVSQSSYTIPQTKYPNATTIEVTSYADPTRLQELKSASVSIICPSIPDPVHRGSEWLSTDSYRNGDFLERTINNVTSYYMWSSRVSGNTTKAPWDATISEAEKGYWEHVTERTIFVTKVLMAKCALLGSAVFNDEYMMSQQGDGTTYKDFDPATNAFTPNILLNFLTGDAHFAKKNVIFDKDGNVDINGNLKAGRIGSFFINKGLTNMYRESQMMPPQVDPNAYIAIYRPQQASFEVNEGGVGICDISVEQGSSSGSNTGLNIETRGDYTQGLRVLVGGGKAQGIYVKNTNEARGTYAIEAEGSVSLKARSTEWVKIHGLSLNVTKVSADKILMSNDDLIILQSAVNVRLPDASTNVGKLYFFKSKIAGSVLHSVSGFMLSGSNSVQQTLKITSEVSFQMISDGTNWIYFFCG